MTVAEYLDAKGIREQAKALNWKVSSIDGRYLQYRALTTDGDPYVNQKGCDVYRMVRWNPEAKVRFYWLPDHEEHKADVPLWYTPEGLWDAVVEANGILRITAGESDMLSLRSIGINNVSALYGENVHPTDWGLTLREYGVESVWYYADADLVGQVAAVEHWWKFQQDKLPMRIMRHLGKINERPIKDVNDAWQAVKFNGEMFKTVIDNMKSWELDALLLDITAQVESDDKQRQWLAGRLSAWDRDGLLEYLKLRSTFNAVVDRWRTIGILPQPRLVKDVPTTFDSDVPVGLWEEIESLTVAGKSMTYEGDGWTRERYKCPTGIHEDKNSPPAFKLNHLKHIGYCHKCGRDFLWKEMAQLYGIYQKYVHKHEPAPSQPAPTPTPANPNKPSALPDGIKVVSWEEMANKTKAKIIAAANNPKEIQGLPFGFRHFDVTMQGLLPEDLFMILARPAMGKSTFVMQAAMSFLRTTPVVIVSPEMTAPLWMERMLDNLFGHKQRDITTGRLTDVNRVLEDVDAIYRNRKEIAYIDSNNLTQQQLISIARAYKERGFGAMIVDSVQNVNASAGDVYTNTRLTMGALETISNNYLPVLCSCQANRGSKDSPKKMPSITDAEGGGTIEQKAKRIVVVHRPFYSVEVGEQDDSEGGDPRLVISRCYKDRIFNNAGQKFEFQLERDEAYGFVESEYKPPAKTERTTIYLNQPHTPQLAVVQKDIRAIPF